MKLKIKFHQTVRQDRCQNIGSITLRPKAKRSSKWSNIDALFGHRDPFSNQPFFWPKFGSDEDWVCQLLIEYVNDKSSRSQKETEYALCQRQGPGVLFPLKLRKGDKTEQKETFSKWDPLSCLLPPYNSETSASQVESQDQDRDSSQETPEVQLKLPSESPGDTLSAVAQLQVTVHPFWVLRRKLQQCKKDIQNLPFPPSLKMQSQTFYPLREVPIGSGNLLMPWWLARKSEI
jgi:hypothetical protein